ncbi:hypothetical protein A6U98_00290 [Rhizobium sp. WYCCWR10014]|nr:hypothetical protein A6U98_00290 [Rhizobium sp. WYCCWR10014]
MKVITLTEELRTVRCSGPSRGKRSEAEALPVFRKGSYSFLHFTIVAGMECRTSFVTKRSIPSATTIAVWIAKPFAGMCQHERTLRKLNDQGPESL